jgi:hypothetical protein
MSLMTEEPDARKRGKSGSGVAVAVVTLPPTMTPPLTVPHALAGFAVALLVIRHPSLGSMCGSFAALVPSC